MLFFNSKVKAFAKLETGKKLLDTARDIKAKQTLIGRELCKIVSLTQKCDRSEALKCELLRAEAFEQLEQCLTVRFKPNKEKGLL